MSLYDDEGNLIESKRVTVPGWFYPDSLQKFHAVYTNLQSKNSEGFIFMHPIEFKKKWKLTYNDLALVLGYENDFTVRCWGISGVHKRNPQKVVYVACRLLDEKWSAEGKLVDSYLS